MLLQNKGSVSAGLAKSEKSHFRECKPDYEEWLQSARISKEKVEADIKAFEGMDDYYFSNDSECFLTALYGAMHKTLKDRLTEIDDILKMIDDDVDS